MPKYTRSPSIVICKFDKDFDPVEVDRFIKKWIGFCVYICNQKSREKLRIYDQHFIKSCALEGCFVAFIRIKEEFKDISISEKLEKSIISIKCKQVTYHSAVVYKYIPDKKRVFFPKRWVSWEEYFAESCSEEPKFFDNDIKALLSSPVFTETEKKFINLSLRGLDPIEIAQTLGYCPTHIHTTLRDIEGRLTRAKEVESIAKTKYGCVGPYRKK